MRVTENIRYLSVLAGLISCVLTMPSFAQGTDKNDSAVEYVKRATQELLDAIAPGRKEVWEKHLLSGALYTDEEGNVKSRDEILKELVPLPKGYVGSIKMGTPKVFAYDNVIVLSHRDREELELFNQNIVTYFHLTSTWVRQPDGQWKIAGMMVAAIPNERKPIAIDPSVLNLYAGQYQVSPDVFYTISIEGGKLHGQRTGRNKEELLPLCTDVFYKKGVWRGEKVFERNAEGKIVRMLDRRENNDLVWTKVK